MQLKLTSVFMASLFFAAACSGPAEQAEPTMPSSAEPSSQEPVEPDPPPETETGWAAMSSEERAALMRERVIPEMTRVFQEFDGERYESFTCVRCHGQSFQEVSFRMPNGLAPLNPADIPTMAESENEAHARFAPFMFGQVVPGMVEILGVPPYNPETGQGFGCMSCHATAE